MQKIIFLILILLVGFSLNSKAESDHIKEFKQKMEIEKQVFSHDDIYLGSDKKHTLSKFKNCKEVHRPNWSFVCEGKKTYLFAFKDDSLKRYQINTKISVEEKTKLIENLNKVYGPANIVEQNVKRPFEGHLSLSPYVSDATWHSTEPHIYIWKETNDFKEHDDVKTLTLHIWPTADSSIFGLSTTVTKGDIDFYEEGKAVDFDKFILDKETDLKLGLNKSLNGLLFLALVLLFKHLSKKEPGGNGSNVFGGIVIVGLILYWLFNGIAIEFGLHPLGFILLIIITAITGWFLSFKKL